MTTMPVLQFSTVVKFAFLVVTIEASAVFRSSERTRLTKICDLELNCGGILFEPPFETKRRNQNVSKAKFMKATKLFVVPDSITTWKNTCSNLSCSVFVSEKEWLIQPGVVNPPFIQNNSNVVHVSYDMTIEEARIYCKAHSGCLAFSFPLQSTKSLITLDVVIFVASIRYGLDVGEEEPSGTPVVCGTEDRELEGPYCDWITHVLNDKHTKHLATLGQIDKQTIYTAPEHWGRKAQLSLYHPCCTALGEDRSLRIPTVSQVREAETIERIPCNLTREEFVREYESKRKPVVLEGCDAHWPGKVTWNGYDVLSRRDGIENTTEWWTCGEFFMTWSEAVNRMTPGNGNSCIFQRIVKDGGHMEQFSNEYSIPKPFEGSNFYDLLKKSSFPPGQSPMAWFTFGDALSGSDPHYDLHLPSTDAWNTLVRGYKWWILFPPSELLDEEAVECDEKCSTDKRSADWFASVGYHAHKFIYEDNLRPIHVLQNPGDTIYFPDIWMHSLLNLRGPECVAVTHCYGSESNLQQIWKQILVRGEERDWRKLYFSFLTKDQRALVREAVTEELVCVRDDAIGNEKDLLCRSTVFSQKVRNYNNLHRTVNGGTNNHTCSVK